MYYNNVLLSMLTSVEKLWIPSIREMFNGTSYKSSGVVYTTVLKNNTAKIKNRNGEAEYWWLRSVITIRSFRSVNGDNDGSANSFYGFPSASVLIKQQRYYHYKKW